MRWALVVAIAVSLHVASARAQAPSLESTLTRVSAYVAGFVGRFSQVVADERYVQERSGNQAARREIRADYALIRLEGASDLIEFRDVYDVDGRSVATRQARVLAFLVPQPGLDWTARARRAAQESARFNLADIGNLNRPLLVITFLQSQWRDHFDFSLKGIDKKVSAAARVMTFREKQDGRPVYAGGPLRGRVWIDDTSGAVLKTELEWGGSPSAHKVVVTFASDPALGIYLPAEMVDTHAFGQVLPMNMVSGAMLTNSNAYEVTGRATYGQFRQFGIETDERVTTPR